jgi:hypothetical protein
MCPKGHELLLASSRVARLRWSWHARRCAECAEVGAADRFVSAYAARAGGWPLPAAFPTPLRRRWQFAVAAGLVLALLPLLLSGLIWRRNAVDTASARAIRVVHWVGEQTIDGATTPYEETIEYPNRVRTHVEQDIMIADLGEGRELTMLGRYTTLDWHPTPYRYLLQRPLTRQIRPREFFTLAGQVEGKPKHGRVLIGHGVSQLANGRELHVLTYRDPALPQVTPTMRLEIDPSTHLVLAWDKLDGWLANGHGRVVTWRLTASRVEYNPELPADYFSTEPPAGEEVVDRLTPEGIRRDYLAALAELESLPADRQAVLAKEWQDNGCFNKLDALSSSDREEIQTRLRALGWK